MFMRSSLVVILKTIILSSVYACSVELVVHLTQYRCLIIFEYEQQHNINSGTT